MSELIEYANRFANATCERRDGVLQVRLHTDDGPWIFSEQGHHDLPVLFDAIAGDVDNKVVILTGTGDRFCTGFDVASFLRMQAADPARARQRIMRDSVRLMAALADIEVPVISAVNGPALVHAEIPLVADVVLAADTLVVQDPMHFVGGNVPGDGVHSIWPKLLGPNEGRHFLLTGRKLSAAEALRKGVVSELLPPDRLLPRAWELALAWAALPRHVLVATRHVLNYEWKRLLHAPVLAGFTEQGFAIAMKQPFAGDPATMKPLEFMPSD